MRHNVAVRTGTAAGAFCLFREFMSQQILLRVSLPIAFVRLAQTVVPALVIALTLYFIARLNGQHFDQLFLALAAIAAVLSGILLQPPKQDAPILQIDAGMMAIDMLFRWAITMGLLFGVGYITGFAGHFPRRIVGLWVIVAPLLAFGTALVLQILMRRVVMSRENQRSAVIVGVNGASLQLAGKLADNPELCTSVAGYFDDRGAERLEALGKHRLLGRLSELGAYVRSNRIDVIFIALPIRHVQRVMDLLDELHDSTASIYYVPDVFVFDLIQSRTAEIMGIPVVAMCETPFYGYRGVMKRVTDIGFTIMIMVIALLPMLVIAALVKLTSKGSVIFLQRRYGLDGEEIVVYKFRTMRVTEDGAQITQATRNDPRVTPVGGFLRRFSLDELPQLINVIQGRMSLVGPRPHAVAHNEQYRRLIKGYMIRHKVLPGITGLAQVSGCRGETAELEQMQARVNYDLDYLRRWSPTLDLKILVKTALQTVFGDRVY
jgi:putative colanic acid biosynthesis UDP-glucose lipid carrier transferase